MKKMLMGLIGLVAAVAIAPAVALAAEPPPASEVSPVPLVEVAAGELAEASGQILWIGDTTRYSAEDPAGASSQTAQVGDTLRGVTEENAEALGRIAQVDGAAYGDEEDLAAALGRTTQIDAEAQGEAEGLAATPDQIVQVGGTAQGEGEDGVAVTVGKTIAPSGIENYFDITLVVEVAEPIEDDSTAVIIVMDISNTMNEDSQGRGPSDAGFTQSRLVNAQVAANEFIQQYCEGEGLSASRQLGIVTFNTNAQWAEGLGMQLVTAADVENLQASVLRISAPSTPSEIRFTNMEAGLLLAKNALDEIDAAHKYVVFLTDGFPTTYVDRSIAGNAESSEFIQGYNPYEPGAYQAAAIGQDGYFADAVLGLPCTYGTSYSDKAAQRAAEIAATMKSGAAGSGASSASSASGIDIFSVGIAIGSQTVQSYVDRATPSFSIVDRTSSEYVIGSATDPSAYENWLAADIAGGPSLGVDLPAYANGDDLESMRLAFESILDSIKATSGLPLQEAVVTDPMGANIEFLYFYDRQGLPADALVGSPGVSEEGDPLENTASYVEANATLAWNLMQSGYSVLVDDEGARTYAYELKYRVRLTNEAEGFAFASEVPTNGTASFEYKTSGTWNDPVAFPIPAVRGFAGQLSFTKVDATDGHPVSGAVFELSHSADCAECAAARTASDGLVSAVHIEAMKAVSGADGVVDFQNVPSGHDYALAELEPAEGYFPFEGRYAAAVAYGVTTVANEIGEIVFGESADGSFVIENEPIEVPPVDPPIPPVDPPIPPDDPVTPTPPTKVDLPGVPLAQTGDASPIKALVAWAMLGLLVIGLEVFLRRRSHMR